MDSSPPGSPVHGISQASILEWVAISSSSGYSWPRDGTHTSWVSCIGRQILYHWATREARSWFWENPNEEPYNPPQRLPLILPSMMSYTYDGIWVWRSMAWGKTSKDRGVPSLLLPCPAGTQRTSGFISSDHCLPRGEFWATGRKCLGSHWRGETNPSALGWWFWANPSQDPSQGTSSVIACADRL